MQDPNKVYPPAWSVEDMRELFPGVDDDVLLDAMDRNATRFNDRITELGWDVWTTLISMDLKVVK